MFGDACQPCSEFFFRLALTTPPVADKGVLGVASPGINRADTKQAIQRSFAASSRAFEMLWK
jgi:hypothetical protein